MKRRGTKRELEARRMAAAEMLKRGVGPYEVARAFGVTHGAASHWKIALEGGGIEALKAKPNPGGTSRMSDEQRATLTELLIAGARASGFDTDLWTLPRVARLIEQRFGISYESSHVSRILKRLGFSPQKPERRAREQDEAAVARWRERDWVRIKKKPAEVG
jgi:transposase